MVNNVFFSAVTAATMSRHELLAWVNDSLSANLTKIEEMSTGSAYCGMTDLLFPGSVQLKKVKWNSRHEIDWINNWKILQSAWKQLGVDKPVPVEKLMKGKFQENFEFLQWFRKFFDANYEEHSYDPLAARNYEDFPSPLPGGNKQLPRASVAKPAPARVPAAAVNTRRPGPIASSKTSAPTAKSSPSANSTGMEEKYKKQLEELSQELAIMNENVCGLEKERNFYFNKLRAVEILVTSGQEDDLVPASKITKILYETEEDGEAEGQIEEAENLTYVEEQPHEDKKTNGHATEEEHKEAPGVEVVAQKTAEVNLDDSETF